MRAVWSSIVLLTACGGQSSTSTLPAVVDSAGVTIVTSVEPAWQKGEGWRIDPDPVLTLGQRQAGDPNYQFLRISGGTILPDGRIVLLLAGSQELRFFSPEGKWLLSAGGNGDGPGEMRRPTGLAVTHDTLFVRDPGLGRLSAFGADGAFLASWLYPNLGESGRIFPNDRLSDGTWIGTPGVGIGSHPTSANTTARFPVTYVRLSEDLRRVEDTVVTTAGAEQHLSLGRTGPEGFGMITVRPPPFGRITPVTTAGYRVIWGDTGIPEIRIHAPTGELQAILRWTAPRIPVTPDLIAKVRDASLALVAGDSVAQKEVEERFAIAPVATEVPAFSNILADADGAIWVAEYPILPSDSTRFRIFDQLGQMLGTVALGPMHSVLEVGRDRILAVWRDADGVEQVRVYRLRKPTGR